MEDKTDCPLGAKEIRLAERVAETSGKSVQQVIREGRRASIEEAYKAVFGQLPPRDLPRGH